MRWARTYRAQVLEVASAWGPIRHLKIWRMDRAPIRAGWDVLQVIKNDMLGEEANAVEVFPPTALLVDEVNYRHLWEIPADCPLPFGLHLTRRD